MMKRAILLLLVSILFPVVAHASVVYELLPASQLGVNLAGSITVVDGAGPLVTSDEIESWQVSFSGNYEHEFSGLAAVTPVEGLVTDGIFLAVLPGTAFSLADIDGPDAFSIAWTSDGGTWTYDAGVTSDDLGELLWSASVATPLPIGQVGIPVNEPTGLVVLAVGMLAIGMTLIRV